MSYYSELKKLIAAGHDPDTSPTVAALRSLHGGDRTVNVSTVGRAVTRTAAFEEDRRETDWYNKQYQSHELHEQVSANLEADKKFKI